MKYEKPRKGNPLQLTIALHIITIFCIANFVASDEKVEVMQKSTNNATRMKPDDPRLCVQRSWDQRSESGYMQKIENNFHKSISALSNQSDRDHDSISWFCALWRARIEIAYHQSSDSKLFGVTGDILTKEQEEIIEKK